MGRTERMDRYRRTSLRRTSFRTKRQTSEWKHHFRRVVSHRPQYRVLGNILSLNSGPQRESCTRKPLSWHIDSVTCLDLLSDYCHRFYRIQHVFQRYEENTNFYFHFSYCLRVHCVCFKLTCTLYFTFVFISIWREIYTCMFSKCSGLTYTVYLRMTMEMKYQEYAVIDHHMPIRLVKLTLWIWKPVWVLDKLLQSQCDSLAVQGNNYFIN